MALQTDGATGNAGVLRKEDPRLVTGTGAFSADWYASDMVHAFMVRADRAHARIAAIDTADALALPGVLRVLTIADADRAGFRPLPNGAALKGVDDAPQKIAPMPVLARDRVRYVGQPIAMVIAETAALAQDAAEQVRVDYEDLPAVATIEAARGAGAPLLHDQVPGNLSRTFEDGDQAAVEAAFDRAAKTARIRVVSQRLSGAPMEPRACFAAHDPACGVTRIHTPTQGLIGMRATLAAVTGWATDSIEVVARDVGGSFGLRGGTASEQVLSMLMARELGRPVKWVATRGECFVAEWHGRALVLDGSIALDADDRILAIRFDDEVDLGGYSCYFGGFIGTRNISVTMGGVYRVPALYMRSRLYYTNTTPVSAYRGAGRPDIAFAIERLIDHAAAEHGLDRVELRRKNFIAPDAFPYRTANGTEYDCGEFDRVMSRALELADYDGFDARRDAARKRGRVRGIGFGCYLEASGGGSGSDQVNCRFSADGRMTIFAMTGPSGQGHETSFARIAAEGLGLDPALIDYRPSDPSSTLIGNGTGGSRSLYGAGSAIKALIGAVLDKARPLAARALDCAQEAVRFENGRFVGNGDRTITVAELARQMGGGGGNGSGGVGSGGGGNGGGNVGSGGVGSGGVIGDGSGHPLDTGAAATSGSTFPNGCHVAELEIDPRTGLTSVVNYVAIDDLGNVISPPLVAGQVHGGVVQGLGQALGERIVYDDSAQILTGSFSDYPMPQAGTLPRITVEQVNVPTQLNALGAKGVGEAGCSGSLPAVSNAMADALRSVGLGPIDMPYTPPRVWEALRGARVDAASRD
ncbi:MAG: xanthine dehydrogenase family protein molybdopterin-binding subunit [Burkholderiaceae bacterium]